MANNVKTVFLLGLLSGIILFIGGSVAGERVLTLALLLAVAMNFGSYFFSDKIDFSDTVKNLYHLNMFIYPSGSKLHTGHWYHYGPSDSWARYKRLKGYNVFEPMGYDAFGLPAENYAIQTGIHPQDSTIKNIKDMKAQLKRIGLYVRLAS